MYVSVSQMSKLAGGRASWDEEMKKRQEDDDDK